MSVEAPLFNELPLDLAHEGPTQEPGIVEEAELILAGVSEAQERPFGVDEMMIEDESVKAVTSTVQSWPYTSADEK